jgi:hypothetical protein
MLMGAIANTEGVMKCFAPPHRNVESVCGRVKYGKHRTNQLSKAAYQSWLERAVDKSNQSKVTIHEEPCSITGLSSPACSWSSSCAICHRFCFPPRGGLLHLSGLKPLPSGGFRTLAARATRLWTIRGKRAHLWNSRGGRGRYLGGKLARAGATAKGSNVGSAAVSACSCAALSRPGLCRRLEFILGCFCCAAVLTLCSCSCWALLLVAAFACR